ncbi:hypothetical protein AGMMS49974_02810 [Deltaproteobacteria bacterium]|nr:hypothetical protein AGMMS49974_02810 [Deltaproteobacteria bacterium]
MNKVIISLLVAVCVLGMALVMLNEKMGSKTDPLKTKAEIGTTASPQDDAASVLPQEQVAPDALVAAPSQHAKPAPTAPPLPEDSEMDKADKALAAASALQPDRQQAVPAAKTQGTGPSGKNATYGKPVAGKKAAPVNPPTRLAVFVRDKGATVRLTSHRPPIRYKTMNLTNPERVVVDVEGLDALKAPGVPKNPLVTNVRVGRIEKGTRIVIDLSTKPKHTRFVLSNEGDTLNIRLY